MTIKEEIYNEIKKYESQYGLEHGLLDISIKSAKDLDASTRRRVIFELEREKKVVLRHLMTNNDARFPLTIIDCN